VVTELDHKRAFDVFAADLKRLATNDAVAQSLPGASPTLRQSLAGSVPGIEEMQQLFKGEVHVAFPVPQSDQKDYMVRNAIGIDPEEGHLAIAHDVMPGETMMFVQRDDAAMQADLVRTLTELKKRVIRERGEFAPKGGLYISCLSRAMGDFGQNGTGVGGEMGLVRDILGDLPLAGFYANGEISNHRLYGYTSIIILFH
jgi:small ligand-binding sensory domain FIST